METGAFEAMGISGVSLAQGPDVLGIRLATPHPALGLFDEKDVLMNLVKPDAYAPDLSYVCYRWRVPVTTAAIRRFAKTPIRGNNSPTTFPFTKAEAATISIEWQRVGDIVQGRYTADRPIRAALIVNGCFAPARVTQATRTSCELRQGKVRLQVRLAGKTTTPVLVDNRNQAEIGRTAGRAMAMYPVTLAPNAPLYFTLRLGKAARPARIAHSLSHAATAYSQTRMRSTGAGAEAMAALSGYSRTYDPKRRRMQTTVNRTWATPNCPGGAFGWDNFFTSYIAAWENPALAAKSLEHVVSLYGERGVAHGPPQRNLIVPIVYCRTLDVLGDERLARRTWPVMMDFMRFWFPRRDGNRDGLIESGSSEDVSTTTRGYRIQNAMDETGYDEIPIYSAGFADGRRGLLADGVEFDERSQCLSITLVCQNSLYIASCRKMQVWAERLGDKGAAAWLNREARRVARRMRERLFDGKNGVFRDRFWSGKFSPVKAMTRFYPLLAGIAEAATRAQLKKSLLDPHQFWGANVVPTVSRDDPTYCDGLDGRGNYWRGNCWPPTTYIVYLAAKEAGWDDVAAGLARRANAQFMEYWRTFGHAYENYPPEGKVDHRYIYPGGPWGGREIRYVWSALMPLCQLEEAFAPETTGEGIRFGNPHLPANSKWERFRYAGELVSAVAGPPQTGVQFGASWDFQARPGISVRRFVWSARRFAWETSTKRPGRVALRTGWPAAAVRVNGKPTVCRHRAGVSQFELPAGQSRVEVLRD